MDLFRKKILEAILFFSGNVKNPTKMMMYKLLAEFDMRHFHEKGYPSTNLEYHAWPFGPVPAELDREISNKKEVNLPEDYSDSLSCEKYEFEDDYGNVKHGFRFSPRRNADLTVFTPREQRILKEVAEIYRTATATEASKASHERGKPWSKTSKGEKIDFAKTIKLPENVSEEDSREIVQEIQAFHHNYRSK